MKIQKIFLEKTFGDVEGYDDMVVQKNISVQSHCEHHMAPIIGIAHVAYIPKERVVGLSKLARVVEVFSKRLQTQERLTMQIATTLNGSIRCKRCSCFNRFNSSMYDNERNKKRASNNSNKLLFRSI